MGLGERQKMLSGERYNCPRLVPAFGLPPTL